MVGLDLLSIIGPLGGMGNVDILSHWLGGAGVPVFSAPIVSGFICPGSTIWPPLVLLCCMGISLSSMPRSIGALHCSGSWDRAGSIRTCFCGATCSCCAVCWLFWPIEATNSVRLTTGSRVGKILFCLGSL